MAARKIMNLKQIADTYGIDYRTFKKDMGQMEGVYNDLDNVGFDGRKFYPIHQQIIEEYFGRMPEIKSKKK